MTVVVGIQCDGCGQVRAATTHVHASIAPERAAARAAGWHKTRGVISVPEEGIRFGYARDICPTCWTAGER